MCVDLYRCTVPVSGTSKGAAEVARLLLASGRAQPLATVAGTGETALHLLAQRSEDGASQDEQCGGGVGHDAPARCEVAALLLAAGLDVNARTSLAGHTPVWLAAFHGSRRLAAWLAAHGGDPRIKDDGKNPSLKPADALQAPLLNEARRAYARSPKAFQEECAALTAELRRAWEGRKTAASS